MINTVSMRCAAFILLCACLGLVACENEPRSAVVASPESAWLGLPGRIDPPAPERAFDLMSRLSVPGEALISQSPDSVSFIASGTPLSLRARLPALDLRDVAGVRLRWRGTLGGDLCIAWVERGTPTARKSLDAVYVPGGAVEKEVELGFGPTRLFGRATPEVSIEVPMTEIGPVTVSGVELLLRPGRTIHRVAIDGQVRRVLVPGPDRALEWDLQVSGRQVIEFEYGTHPLMRVAHGDGTRFMAQIVAGRDTTTVIDRWISAFAVPEHRSWQRARIDMAPWEGESVALRLQAVSGPEASGIFPGSRQTRDDEPLFTIPRLVSAHDPRPNVLVIVIDTLRRDALGAYGGGPSPHLDSLAVRGIRFDRAWATGSWTHPSTASLLSGWLPSAHGLGYGPPGTTRLAGAAPMIAGDLLESGWNTAAASNNRIVSVEDGFGRGFAAFDERAFEADQFYGAERMTRAAMEWVDDHPDGPFFLYLHYFDPHDRYQAPKPFTHRHIRSRLKKQIQDSSVRAGRPNAFIPAINPDARELTDDELRYLRGLYRGEVSYVDHWIGRLVDHLEESGRFDDTIVVVTSDHGEEFLEHGGLKHAHTLYEELMSVPLLVRLPGDLHAGSVRTEPVSLIGLPATLRALAGAPVRDGDRPWPLAGPASPRPALAENWWDEEGPHYGLQQALVDWPHKLIRYADGSTELFDLVKDPGEQDPVDDGEQLGRMTAQLDSLLAGSGSEPVTHPTDPALLEKLKAMGYVH